MKMIALASAALLALAACSPKPAEDTTAATEPSNQTLASAVRDVDPALAGVIDNAGLRDALDGVGPYTLFAPPEGALNGAGTDFADPAMSAQSAALIQAHIVPGTVTRADIDAAIDAAGPDGAQMRTMAGDMITFTRDGDAIVARSPDGATVHLTGDEQLLSNGALQPVDGLLVKAEAAG